MSSREAFQVGSLTDYRIITSSLMAHSDLRDFGNPYFLDINYDMLAEAVSLITTTFKDELQTKIVNYSDFRLTYSFVYNTLVYALVNQRKQVGKEEITGMLQAWSYVPFSFHNQIAQILNEELFIEENTSSQQSVNKIGQKRFFKIIPFPSKKQANKMNN